MQHGSSGIGRAVAMGLIALAAAAGFARTSHAGVLWDQIGATGSDLPTTGPEGYYRYGSQVFSGQPQYDLIALDDFTLAGESRIDRFEAVIQGYGNWSGTGNIQGLVARVFASPQQAAAGWSNAVATVQLAAPSAYTAFGTGLLCGFDVDITLGAGRWYIGLQAIMPGSAGQVGVVISNLGAPAQAFQANPGGGFGVPGNLIERPVNLAYRLSGSAVPGPGACVMLAVAASLMGRRKVS
ncbi:MAG: hypothetical protein FJ292_09550 [Planctomycetes bacterium]|nr:hypothetical protein [Planctomycetota bacterium]